MPVWVTPYAGVWIEIELVLEIKRMGLVTPYAGVWIEMSCKTRWYISHTSLPTRECGLKYLSCLRKCNVVCVTPYAGVWIEISRSVGNVCIPYVTPYAGVWIEIASAADGL